MYVCLSFSLSSASFYFILSLAAAIALPSVFLALCKYLISALKSICFHDSVIHCLSALTSITPSATPPSSYSLPHLACLIFSILPANSPALLLFVFLRGKTGTASSPAQSPAPPPPPPPTQLRLSWRIPAFPLHFHKHQTQ